MKKILISAILLIFFINITTAQDLSVESFRKLSDMDARINEPKEDQNGDKCAIIKVVTNQKAFAFEGDALGITDIVQKTGEIWVYVPMGARRITIKHSELGVLRDYIYPIAIEQAKSYELKLLAGKVKTIIQSSPTSQWLVIKTKPEAALVYINNKLVGQSPFQKKFKAGNYNLKLELANYKTLLDTINIKSTNKYSMNHIFEPNYGVLNISSSPENGANLFVDGKALNKTTPSLTGKLSPGKHTITLMKKLYKPTNKEVYINAGDSLNMNIDLIPNFSNYRIYTKEDIDIYINGENKKSNNWTGKLEEGLYIFETRSDKYYNEKKEIQVLANNDKEIELKPIAKTGILDISTTPFEADVFINDKNYGKTPLTISKLIVGKHKVSILKEGYNRIEKIVTIEENANTNLSETLTQGKKIRITTKIPNYDLYVDNNYIGTTPIETVLAKGERKIRLKKGEIDIVKTIQVDETTDYINIDNTIRKKILISSTPNKSSVYVDGKYKGSTPLQIEIDQNSHLISVKKYGYKESIRNINLTESNRSEIIFSLDKDDSVARKNTNKWPKMSSVFGIFAQKTSHDFYLSASKIGDHYTYRAPLLLDAQFLGKFLYARLGFLDYIEYSEHYTTLGYARAGVGFGFHSRNWNSIFYVSLEAGMIMILEDDFKDFYVEKETSENRFSETIYEYENENDEKAVEYKISFNYMFNIGRDTRLMFSYGMSKIEADENHLILKGDAEKEVRDKGLNIGEFRSYLSLSLYF
ncbi:MAG: PEGA domain-containing protein [Marinifilaceae bacterium]|jgi:hypothetical protein|nr:PEGA domain-containing protein [Marinifilaceae bacterium]